MSTESKPDSSGSSPRLRLIDGPAAGREIEWHELPEVFYVPAPPAPVRVFPAKSPDVPLLKYAYRRSTTWRQGQAMAMGFWPYYFEGRA